MDALSTLQSDIKDRYASGQVINIQGGGTRAFLGYPAIGEALSVSQHSGVINYHPEELVIQARAGTPLSDITTLLDAEGQMLAFEPPAFGAGSTIGGVVASGLSGSRRPYTGAVRDYVLGVGLILHDGEYLSFGGQVMKNVAGYDVSRLVCGSYGMLGVIADVSLKVLPKPAEEISLCFDLNIDEAVSLLSRCRQRSSAVSGACYLSDQLHVRLSGSEPALAHERQVLGGEHLENTFWASLDAQVVSPFVDAHEIWRLSTSPWEDLSSSGCTVFDWGFAQRWMMNPERDPRLDYQGEGHWTMFRRNAGGSVASVQASVFEALASAELSLHQRIKSVFDPAGLFNPGRMYEEL